MLTSIYNHVTGIYNYILIALITVSILSCYSNGIDSTGNSYRLPDLLCDNEASAKQYLLSFFESLGHKDAVAARNHVGSKEANFYGFVIYPEAVRVDRYHPLDFSQYDLSTVELQIEAVIDRTKLGETFSLEVFDYNYIGGGGRAGSEAHFRYIGTRGDSHKQMDLRGKGAFNCQEKKIVALTMVTDYNVIRDDN